MTTYLQAGRRLAVKESLSLPGWYVGYSPRNESNFAEGRWEEWVELAKMILVEDTTRELYERSVLPKEEA